jgi:hypothetical protein
VRCASEHDFVDHSNGLYDRLADRGRGVEPSEMELPSMQTKMFDALAVELRRRWHRHRRGRAEARPRDDVRSRGARRHAPLFDVTHLVFDGTVRGADATPMQIIAGMLSVTTNPSQYGFTAGPG